MRYASQQNKHFQRGLATVLCTTVNLMALAVAALMMCGPFRVRRAMVMEASPRGVFEADLKASRALFQAAAD
jgi:hypothetical protein